MPPCPASPLDRSVSHVLACLLSPDARHLPTSPSRARSCGACLPRRPSTPAPTPSRRGLFTSLKDVASVVRNIVLAIAGVVTSAIGLLPPDVLQGFHDIDWTAFFTAGARRPDHGRDHDGHARHACGRHRAGRRQERLTCSRSSSPSSTTSSAGSSRPGCSSRPAATATRCPASSPSAGGDKDIALARFQAEIQLASLKAASSTWWGARLIILVAGVPCAVHIAAIMIDSTFMFGWRVPRVPAPYDTYEWAIVQSFFLVNVAQHVTSTLSTAWLGRK